MTKRVRTFLYLVHFISICAQAFSGRTFSDSSFIYKEIRWEGVQRVLIVGYQTPDFAKGNQPLHIPSSVTHEGKNYNVWCVASGAFRNLYTAESIVVEDGIERILDHAFEDCTGLKSISIPASVQWVGEGLFSGCHQLEKVIVDSKNRWLDSRDDSNAIIYSDEDELLAACPATRIPTSVKIIGNEAFSGCYMLEQIDIPEGVESIENSAFEGCSGLRRLSLPESLRKIGWEAFSGCSSLKSIFIPKNVEQIANVNIFSGCTTLSSIVVDDRNTFYDSREHCNGIVRKADSMLVASCRATSIPESLKGLYGECFYGINMHSIRIPKSLESLSGNSFFGCKEIDTIFVAEGNPAFISPEGSNAILTKDGKTLVVGCRTTEIPSCVEKIGELAFYGRYEKPVLCFPKNIKRVSESSFENCNGLYKVVIPPSVTKLDGEVFYNCHNLMNVQIQARVPEIPRSAFENCYRLKVVTIADGTKAIGQKAFAGCTRLTHISLPQSIEKIGEDAFMDCPYTKNLKEK